MSRGIFGLEFEAGSGGIILDASEKGLGFQAADAAQQLGLSRIWIWISPRPRSGLRSQATWYGRIAPTKPAVCVSLRQARIAAIKFVSGCASPVNWRYLPNSNSFPGPRSPRRSYPRCGVKPGTMRTFCAHRLHHEQRAKLMERGRQGYDQFQVSLLSVLRPCQGNRRILKPLSGESPIGLRQDSLPVRSCEPS
jgi:hypothetical protein